MKFIFFFALVISGGVTPGQSQFPYWPAPFQFSFPQFQRNLHLIEDLNHNIQQMNEEITHGINTQLAQINQAIGEPFGNISENSSIVKVNGFTTITTNDNSGARTIISGFTPGGVEYWIQSVQRISDNYLFRNETLYNPVTKIAKSFIYKRNLLDVNAEPIVIQY